MINFNGDFLDSASAVNLEICETDQQDKKNTKTHESSSTVVAVHSTR
jgi:hypothetical protein